MNGTMTDPNLPNRIPVPSANAGSFRKDRLVVPGFVIAFLILLAISALSLRFLERSHESRRMVRHTYDVKDELGGLLSALTDAETGQRGYLLTGDPAYLAPYSGALGEVARRKERLLRLTADNPRQQERLASLDPLIRGKLAELDETIRLRRENASSAAIDIVRSNRGKALLDGIRTIVAEAVEEENRLLAVRSAIDEESRRRITAILLVGTVASLGLFLSVFRLLRSEIALRRGVETELRDHRDLLETRVVERTRSLAAEIEDRTKAERAQREIRRLLQSVIEGTTDVVYARDPAGRVLLANHSAKNLLGLDPAPAAGAADGSLPGPFEAERLAEEDDRARKWGSTRTFEESLICEDGEMRTFLSTKGPLPDREGTGHGMFAISRDITEMKRSESERIHLHEQLRQSQKMEAVGQLAGGIAHYFNNMLQVILGHASFLAERAAEGADREQANEIVETAVRASTLAQGLLSFSRKQPLNLKRGNVNALISGFQRFLEKLIGDNVALRLRLAPGPLYAVLDEIQLQHVLVNLATNARDAMQGRGMMVITTALAEAEDGPSLPAGTDGAGRYVRITLSDTGCGMDDRVREKIFEPFFTTKGIGKGTGLGLAVVHGIIAQHGGTVSCESSPGRGTTFTILLPADAEGEGEEPPVPVADVRRSGGNETVLVAEDDDRVLEVVRLSLERGGYEVLSATDGNEAVSVFAGNRERIRLVILDYSMPGLTGKETLDRIREIDPGVRGFFLSGFAGEEIETGTAGGPAFDLIRKPVVPADLLARVRAVLDS